MGREKGGGENWDSLRTIAMSSGGQYRHLHPTTPFFFHFPLERLVNWKLTNLGSRSSSVIFDKFT